MPKLSIVIAAAHGSYSADSILRMCGNEDVEVLVVGTGFASGAHDSGRVKWIQAQQGATEGEMRSTGMKSASARRIAVLGDRYDVGETWMSCALSDTNEAVWGPVYAPAKLCASGWAIYLAEYSDPMQPVEGNVIHSNLAHDQHSFVLLPALAVSFARPPGLKQYLRERYCDSRRWAVLQLPEHPLFSAVSRLALPALLLWRRGRGAITRRRCGGRFLLSLPYLIVFSLVEMAGEISGFLWGDVRKT